MHTNLTAAATVSALLMTTMALAQTPAKRGGAEPAQPVQPETSGEAKATASEPGPYHKVLGKHFAGEWSVALRYRSAPNAEFAEARGHVVEQMVCNGYWLLSTIESEIQGQPFRAVAMTGYDPLAKAYKSVWLDSETTRPTRSTGAWDASTQSLTMRGMQAGPEGLQPVRSVTSFADGKRKEVSYGQGPGGEEFVVMEILFERNQPASVAGEVALTDAAAVRTPVSSARDRMHDHLDSFLGTWTTELRQTGEEDEQPAAGTASFRAVAGSNWIHQTYRSRIQGQAFEGHGFMGYDATKKQYVSFWIDSMGPHLTHSAGRFESEGKTFWLKGQMTAPTGATIDTLEAFEIQGDDRIQLEIRSTRAGKPAGLMRVDYRRK